MAAARNYLSFLVIAAITLGFEIRGTAQQSGGTTTNTTAPSSTTTTPSSTTAAGASTVSHKTSRHHKKKSTTAVTSATGTGTAAVPGQPAAASSATATTGKARVPAKKTATVAATGKTPAVVRRTVAASGQSTAVGKAANSNPTLASTSAGSSTSTSPASTSATKHKRSHLKKHATASTAAPKPGSTLPDSASAPLTPFPPTGTATTAPATSATKVTTAKSTTPKSSGKSSNLPPAVVAPPAPSPTTIVVTGPPPETHVAGAPEVDTGLPVARHSGYDPSDTGTSSRGTASSTYMASGIPVPTSLTEIGSFTTLHTRVKNPVDHFNFTNFPHRQNVYPWKYNIMTTKFWIGEGGSSVSSTDNVASAWDQDWRSHNGGSDTPGDDRQGYMPAHHAARENPFYVALPFNDLAFPEKARQWLPSGWYKRPRDGKQVSACQHRWIEIKNAQGKFCYAQWEDVGPLNYSDAEYVFGEARPQGLGNLQAGLDVSPAVADYLDITGRNCITRWRFVDDADVVPGKWLQYDEEALIFNAMHQMKDDPNRVLPIQRATAPIDDEEDVDATKKHIGAAKG